MQTHSEVIEGLAVVVEESIKALGKVEAELDAARRCARAAWDFVQEGGFGDDLPVGEVGSPEWELWIKWRVLLEFVEQSPWIKEEG
jgi:hypothetical protein